MKISPSRLASSRHFVSVPLRRTARASDSRPFKRLDLDLAARDGARRGRLVEDLLLGGLDLVVRRIFKVLDILGVERGKAGATTGATWPPALEEFQLAQPAFAAARGGGAATGRSPRARRRAAAEGW